MKHKKGYLAIMLLLCTSLLQSNDSAPTREEKTLAFTSGCFMPWSSFRESCMHMLEKSENQRIPSWVGTDADASKKNQKLLIYYKQGNSARRFGLLVSTILAKRERSQALLGSLWMFEFFFSVTK